MAEPISPILRELPSELNGKRVLVRPYRAGDGPALWEAVEESREHIRPWLPWDGKHQSVADSEVFARSQAAKWLLREDLAMAICDSATGRYLGGTGLHRINWEVPSFEIGYWLRAGAVGAGYVTEAAWLLCQLTFETLGANRVFIRCGAENHRSAAVPKRLGFVYEGTHRNSQRDTNGELYDMQTYAMTPPEYAAQRDREAER